MSCVIVCVTISVCLCECNKAARKFLLQLTHLTVSLYCHLPISLFHTIVYIFLVTFFIRAAQFFRAPRPCYCVFLLLLYVSGVLLRFFGYNANPFVAPAPQTTPLFGPARIRIRILFSNNSCEIITCLFALY